MCMIYSLFTDKVYTIYILWKKENCSCVVEYNYYLCNLDYKVKAKLSQKLDAHSCPTKIILLKYLPIVLHNDQLKPNIRQLLSNTVTYLLIASEEKNFTRRRGFF